MFEASAKPEDRDSIAVYPREILRDHKPGPDGNLIEVHKIVLGRKLSTNYEQIWEVNRLKKEDPFLWRHIEPVYERWLKDNTLTRDGFPLESWPAITKGQLKECHRLGIQVVEDLATATDALREKLGMGATELIKQAKAFMASKDQSAAANKMAHLEQTVADLAAQLKESQATIDALMAEKGKRPTKPKFEPKFEGKAA